MNDTIFQITSCPDGGEQPRVLRRAGVMPCALEFLRWTEASVCCGGPGRCSTVSSRKGVHQAAGGGRSGCFAARGSRSLIRLCVVGCLRLGTLMFEAGDFAGMRRGGAVERCPPRVSYILRDEQMQLYFGKCWRTSSSALLEGVHAIFEACSPTYSPTHRSEAQSLAPTFLQHMGRFGGVSVPAGRSLQNAPKPANFGPDSAN